MPDKKESHLTNEEKQKIPLSKETEPSESFAKSRRIARQVASSIKKTRGR